MCCIFCLYFNLSGVAVLREIFFGVARCRRLGIAVLTQPRPCPQMRHGRSLQLLQRHVLLGVPPLRPQRDHDAERDALRPLPPPLLARPAGLRVLPAPRPRPQGLGRPRGDTARHPAPSGSGVLHSCACHLHPVGT